jgi:hypothetical protein
MFLKFLLLFIKYSIIKILLTNPRINKLDFVNKLYSKKKLLK